MPRAERLPPVRAWSTATSAVRLPTAVSPQTPFDSVFRSDDAAETMMGIASGTRRLLNTLPGAMGLMAEPEKAAIVTQAWTPRLTIR